MKKSLLALSISLSCCNVSAFEIEVVNNGIRVAGDGQVNVFATPLAYANNAIYTANVELPANGAASNQVNYQTVLRKGEFSNGQWKWSSTVINSSTHDDIWHNQPSIAIDKNGKIHIAYNMHNMPWQYKVSNAPYDINGFTFKGDPVTIEEQRKVEIENKTNFPTLGSAAIPGNQITYPAFFKDRNNELYITYRQALKPKLAWANRVYGSGIAKYNTSADHWSPIGGAFNVTQSEADLGNESQATVYPFAQKPEWSLYQTRLAFDRNNNMHVFWYWRSGGAGPEITHPSYAFSTDGGNSFRDIKGKRYTLPITLDQIEPTYPSNSIFSSESTITVDSAGNPSRVMGDLNNNKRMQSSFDIASNSWKATETPYGAPLIFFDKNDTEWAIATGPIILKRDSSTGNQWKKVYEESSRYGFPKVHQREDGAGYFLHMQSNDRKTVKIWQIKTGDISGKVPERPSSVEIVIN